MVLEGVIASWILMDSWIPGTTDVGVYLENSQRHKLEITDLQNLLIISEASVTLNDIRVP